MKQSTSVLRTLSAAQKRTLLRRTLSSSVFTTGLLLQAGFALPARAADPEPAAQNAQQRSEVEEVVVTGSRIVRDGYDAPTPLTVISADTLEDSASTNIADVMRAFPAFAGSTTPQSGITSVSAQAPASIFLTCAAWAPTAP